MNRRQLSRRCHIEAIASLENLFLAARKARRSKSGRPDVEAWWTHRGEHLGRLRETLLAGAWEPQPYRFFEIHSPKRRVIAAAPFEDRVVHHALCNLLAPVLEHGFIARSFSCQVGKGTTAARDCCRRLVNRHAYVLKCDVREYDDSVNLLSSYRNNNAPDNRNDNNGFRVVLGEDSARKAASDGVMPGGIRLPGRSQAASLTVAPAPVGTPGQDAAAAVAGRSSGIESHGGSSRPPE